MRLLPHDQTFFQFFEQHGAKTVEGCRALLALIESPSDLEAQSQRVAHIEQECDDITHAVVESLHKPIITPLDRNAIYRLLTRQDDNMALDAPAADRFSLYEIRRLALEVGELCRTLGSSAEHVGAAVAGRRDMKRAPSILQHC